MSVRWVLVAAPALARQLGTLRSWNDAPWIGWGERLSQIPPARWLATHLGVVEPRLCSDSLRVQLAALAAGVGVALIPEPSVKHYGLAPVKLAARLREAAAEWPSDELFLVTHRALRDVPRVRVLWELLLERAQPGAQQVRQ
jgi:DNA-binding transcriptional LysR family regulator